MSEDQTTPQQNPSQSEQKQPRSRRVRPYDDKPVYVKARELNKNNAVIVSRLPKNFRYSYAEILILNAGNVSSAIIKAFKAFENKEIQLQKAEKIVEACDDYLTELRVVFDNLAVSRKAFSEQSTLCVSIIKQVQGWIKYIKEKACEQSNEQSVTA